MKTPPLLTIFLPALLLAALAPLRAENRMRKELKFKGAKTWLSLKNGLTCCAVAVLALLPAQLQAGPSHMLANDKIRVALSGDGKLEAVENLLASETYSFGSDSFALDTDLGMFSNATTSPVRVTADTQRIVYQFEFGPETGGGVASIKVDLIYTLTADNGFFRRTISISNAAPLRVKNLVFGRTTFSSPARETVHYVTFIAAPTVEFIRHEKGGMFTGIENPYLKADVSEQGVALSFEPALILKAGEGYTSEPQFMGVYRKSGVMIEDSGRDFRYNANASGYKPIDRNEMRAMRAFALDYLAPAQQNFLNINYQFFHPLPQMPGTQKDKDYFTHTIDTFAAIGGDMIIFKPLHPYTKPDASRPYWNVVPDDTNAMARQICDYAAGKGISYGFYMGCAAHGGEGNAGGLSFRPDKPEWKKSDAAGRRAPDNCLACDDYYEWWYMVQNNTIQKYHLSNWSWDPSLGSGMNCYDESHGHIAGRGGYKGWRRCIELMARLKAANPGLFIQGFYGTKNFGLWGLKNVDQHEVLNEQSIIVSTRHNQISDDRQNADGLRYQNNLSMRYRFTPAVTGHALTHRVSEGGFDPELIKAWDYDGWQYAVMSSLAVSGSVMPTILPYAADLVPGYAGFYQKWKQWGKDNFEYVNCTEPFGEQVQPGAVDGYARIKGDHGFVFLFNGNPRPARITFEVGDEINLQADGDYQFAELYPSERSKLVLDANGKSVFARGEMASITVPANGCYLLELRKVTGQGAPVLVGAAGAVALADGQMAITGVEGKPGQQVGIRVRVADPGAVQGVTVNGIAQNFTRTAGEIGVELQFAGDKYVRELDVWTQAGGGRFDFPVHAAGTGLQLTTSFTLNADVAQLLEAAKPPNFAEMDGKIAAWQATGGGGAYHNFICERPSRLWLIVPFRTPASVEVTLNGAKVAALRWDAPSSSAFADLTDLVNYGGENHITLSINGLPADGFMGPFLLYPAEAGTNVVLPGPAGADQPVIYVQSLAPALPTRYRKNAGPKVIEAKMMENVTLTESAELRVKLDLPPAGIKRVMFFESGFTWMGQHGLVYNNEVQCWTARVQPGPRAAIQENDFIYVWAEGTDGLRSDYYPVKVGWSYGDRDEPAAGNFNGNSLQGWHNRVWDGTAAAWVDLDPDVTTMPGTINGGVILPANVGNSLFVSTTANYPGNIGGDSYLTPGQIDAGANTKWIRSPVFYLDRSGDLTFKLIYGPPGGTLPADASGILYNASQGWSGLCLRDATTGGFVLSQQGTSTHNAYSAFSFTAAQLAGLDQSHAYTLDLITTKSGFASWIGLDNVSIPGAPSPPADFFDITASAGTGGAISPSGVGSVARNSTPTYTITPEIGFGIADVVLDAGTGSATHLGSVTSYTFANVQADHTISATFVAALAYDFNGNLLQGWHNRVWDGTASAWVDLDPNVTTMPGTINGGVILPANGGNSLFVSTTAHYPYDIGRGTYLTPGQIDAGANTKWVRSPVFYLNGSGDLTFKLIYGPPGGTLPANESGILYNASQGWSGLCLRDATTGAFVLSRQGTGTHNAYTSFSFTAAQLAALNQSNAYTLDLITTKAGSGSWISLDDVSIPGIPEPSAALLGGLGLLMLLRRRRRRRNVEC
jgi:hypothetical protein